MTWVSLSYSLSFLETYPSLGIVSRLHAYGWVENLFPTTSFLGLDFWKDICSISILNSYYHSKMSFFSYECIGNGIHDCMMLHS